MRICTYSWAKSLLETATLPSQGMVRLRIHHPPQNPLVRYTGYVAAVVSSTRSCWMLGNQKRYVIQQQKEWVAIKKSGYLQENLTTLQLSSKSRWKITNVNYFNNVKWGLERVEYTQTSPLPHRGREIVSDRPSAPAHQIKIVVNKEIRQWRKLIRKAKKEK